MCSASSPNTRAASAGSRSSRADFSSTLSASPSLILKPQVFERIKANEETFTELKKEVYTALRPLIADLDGLDERFEAYLFPTAGLHQPKDPQRRPPSTQPSGRFDIIKHENWDDYEIDEIQRGLQRRQEALSDVEGLQKLALFPTYRSFVDLCGRLRFQVRWGQLTEFRGPRAWPHAHRCHPVVPVFPYD